jgi:hypothetical protein
MEWDEPARRQTHFETAPFDRFGTAWWAIRGEAERSAPRGSAPPLTAGPLMAEERDTSSEVGAPGAQGSARQMTAPVRLHSRDTTGTRAAAGSSK